MRCRYRCPGYLSADARQFIARFLTKRAEQRISLKEASRLTFITKHLAILQKPNKDIWLRPLSAFFAFSFFWAFGGHFKASGMRFLDNMMRDFFAKHQI